MLWQVSLCHGLVSRKLFWVITLINQLNIFILFCLLAWWHVFCTVFLTVKPFTLSLIVPSMAGRLLKVSCLATAVLGSSGFYLYNKQLDINDLSVVRFGRAAAVVSSCASLPWDSSLEDCDFDGSTLTNSLHLSLVVYTLLLCLPADGGHQLWLPDCFQACGIRHRRILGTEVQGTLSLLVFSYMGGDTCNDLSLESWRSPLVEAFVR